MINGNACEGVSYTTKYNLKSFRQKECKASNNAVEKEGFD